jgi:zinc transporter ZupT
MTALPSSVTEAHHVIAATLVADPSSWPISLGSWLPFVSPSIVRAVELGAFPAIGMNLVTVVGLQVPTPPRIVGALQHFSAGILLTTISKELLPEMVNAKGLWENLASGIGFFAGVGVLVALGILLPDDEEEVEKDTTIMTMMTEQESSSNINSEVAGGGEALSEFEMYIPEELYNREERKSTNEEMELSWTSSVEGGAEMGLFLCSLESMPTGSAPSLRNRRLSLRTQSLSFLAGGGGGVDDSGTVGTIPASSSQWVVVPSSEAEGTATVSNNAMPGRLRDMNLGSIAAALPTALLTAITIDSTLDGLLIGISTAVDPDTTGPLLAASLTVESSFLGLTVATALRGRSAAPNTLLWLAASLAPAGIIAGSISGGGLAPLLANDPVLLAGVLGFGTSTILFMVAEELLLQAHEDGSEHVWWVDLQLYTGFFASVMIEKFIGM